MNVENDALKQLLQYRGELFGFIRSIVRNTHDAEDLFQEVAMIIVEKAKEDIKIDNFRAWSKEIVRRKVKEFFRQKRNEQTIHLPVEEMADLADQVYGKYNPDMPELTRQYDALYYCMKKLSKSMRDLIRCRFLRDHSYAQIATNTGKSEITVRKAVSRARNKLVGCVRHQLRLLEEGY